MKKRCLQKKLTEKNMLTLKTTTFPLRGNGAKWEDQVKYTFVIFQGAVTQRSFTICSSLMELFYLLRVDRNGETGENRVYGYVTMGSDVGGREMRVRFSAEMNPGRRNAETMNSSSQKVMYYETPHKLYVGNLARAVKPEDLWNHFRRFGTVVSVRILHDHNVGNDRIYAFLSFLSQSERDAAMSLNETELRGRTLVVRDGIERSTGP